MKKLVLALFVATLLVGVAFAAGHVNPEPFKPIVVVPGDVAVDGADVIGVASADIGDVPRAGIIALANSEGANYDLIAAFELNLDNYKDAAGSVKIDLTEVLAKIKAAGGETPNAVIIAKKDGSGVTEFPIVNNVITVSPVGDYFTANILTFVKKTFAGGSSGGGCSTGSVAPAFLLLLAPLAILLKK